MALLAACSLVLLFASQATAQGSSAWRVTATTKTDAAAQSGAVQSGPNGGVAASALDQMWLNFKVANNRNYNAEQDATAKAFFVSNMQDVFKINQDPTIPYWTSGNKFSDQDPAKIASTILMKIDIDSPPNGRKLMGADTIAVEEETGAGRDLLQVTPKSVDWRSTGKVTAVRNQQQCGSCWAFAATSVIESAYLIGQGLTASASGLDLSEQQMVSCASNAAGYWSYGCDGGWSDRAMKYVFERNQTTETKYGYTSGGGTTGTCSSVVPTLKTGEAVQLNGDVLYVSAKNEAALRARVDIQPVVIYFQVSNSFYSYAGGIYKPTDCGTSINHAMVVVGYSYTGVKANDFWIVRNSWGVWGDGGYIKVTMDGTANGPCGMYYYSAMYPTLTFSKTLGGTASPPPPPPPPPSPPPSPSPPPGANPCAYFCTASAVKGTPDYVTQFCVFCNALVQAGIASKTG